MTIETREVTSSISSATGMKGLLPIIEVEVESANNNEKVVVLCDSACSHSWITETLAKKLDVQDSPTKITVHGINSHQTVETQIVELQLTPVHSGGSC